MKFDGAVVGGIHLTKPRMVKLLASVMYLLVLDW
jgi:hypothetical protein